MKKYTSFNVIKIFLFLSLMCFKAHSGFEAGLFYGRTFGNNIGQFKAKDGGLGHANGVTADLANNPNDSNIYGGEISYFLDHIGFNLELSYSKYKTDKGEITLKESNGTIYKTTFPGFNTEVYTIKPSLIFRYNIIEKLALYAGIGYSVAQGWVDNTKFSMNPMEYGVGGKKTGLFLHGLGLKVGTFYDVTKKIKLGLEYNFNDLTIEDTNQNFRSFNTGFSGSLQTNYIVFKVNYKFS